MADGHVSEDAMFLFFVFFVDRHRGEELRHLDGGGAVGNERELHKNALRVAFQRILHAVAPSHYGLYI